MQTNTSRQFTVPEKPAARTCDCGALLEPQWFPAVPGLRRPGVWFSVERCSPCEAAAAAAQAAADEKARLDRLKIESGMMPLHLRMTWNAYQFSPGSPLERAMKTCLEGKRGLMLVAPPGVGKTHAGCAVLHRHIETTRTPGIFANVPKLMRDLRLAIQRQPDRDHLARLRETPCLVLDDIGVEKPTEFVVEAMYGLLDDWICNDKKRLIVTSNLLPDELAARLGDRCVSRLVGLCEVFNLSGDDRRLNKPQSLP